jgi:hypothetical protein
MLWALYTTLALLCPSNADMRIDESLECLVVTRFKSGSHPPNPREPMLHIVPSHVNFSKPITPTLTSPSANKRRTSAPVGRYQGRNRSEIGSAALDTSSTSFPIARKR